MMGLISQVPLGGQVLLDYDQNMLGSQLPGVVIDWSFLNGEDGKQHVSPVKN